MSENVTKKLLVEQNVSLAKFSYYRVGGRAKYFVSLRRRDDFISLVDLLSSLKPEKICVIGAGSNILISDQGFDGLVIKIDWSNWEQVDGQWVISAGAMLPRVARVVIKSGYGGLEHLANIPGTVGGAIRGNAEAFHQSISDCLIKVLWIDWNGEEKWLSKQECEFGYRDSIFKNSLMNKGIICEAYFDFPMGDGSQLMEVVESDKCDRVAKQPSDYSCGCFFKNIKLDRKKYETIKSHLGDGALLGREVGDMYAAGRLIDISGLKGMRVGGAKISDIHANFIINDGTATASDIYVLHKKVIESVFSETGIALEPEVQICGQFE